MNFITEDVLRAIEEQRPDLASWAEDKRHTLADAGKLESLRWIAFDLDATNRAIACKTLGIHDADIEALRRIFRVI
ncbi:hypothetical protein P245_19740 [Comamonas thiooxydans]|uniref:Uncharacterized protein n=1 Tax=Comamonas thiooxydans TaxID=363952 RepID=A0A0E3BYG0_9BURK|nr:hypothetical protein [Comamonas thiooxydans]KGG87686.1 hypothetical protein P245_19740 [Comamonas thiooxydans]